MRALSSFLRGIKDGLSIQSGLYYDLGQFVAQVFIPIIIPTAVFLLGVTALLAWVKG